MHFIFNAREISILKLPWHSVYLLLSVCSTHFHLIPFDLISRIYLFHHFFKRIRIIWLICFFILIII